jgi:c-di-GMP-binding flagellar brake protein YcgR
MSSSKAKHAKANLDRRRRRHTRYSCDFTVTVSYLHEDKYRTLQGRSRDLSEAGIGLILAADLKVRDVAELKFALPGSASSWEIRAVVRYCQGFQYGFEFLSLTEEQNRSLGQYLKTLPVPH